MRIVYVIDSLATGGAEKLLLDTLRLLPQKGVQAEVVLLNGKKHPFLERLTEQPEIKIHILSQGSVYNPLLMLKLIPFIRKADLAHVHLFPALYWVAFAKCLSFSKTPLVFTEHSTTNRRRNSRFFKMTDRLVYSMYTKIVTISNEVKLALNKHLKFKANRFITIPNGVDLNVFATAAPLSKASLLQQNNHKMLIQVARFSKEKDQETTIRALSLISKSVSLVLVGKGECEGKLRELVASLELTDRVFFLGERNDIAALLQTSDIAILSSKYEGLSLAGVEALASGTPVVASNVPGLSTLVYGAGLFFSYGDEVDLADKISTLLNDPELHDGMAKKAKKRARKYSLDKMVDSYIDLYSKICRNQN